jgi:hypothetical protein
MAYNLTSLAQSLLGETVQVWTLSNSRFRRYPRRTCAGWFKQKSKTKIRNIRKDRGRANPAFDLRSGDRDCHCVLSISLTAYYRLSTKGGTEITRAIDNRPMSSRAKRCFAPLRR